MNKGDIYYYARILPDFGTYDVLDVKIRTIEEDWFVGVETRDRQAFLFSNKDIDKIVFEDRMDALLKVQDAEENKKIVSTERYYEDY